MDSQVYPRYASDHAYTNKSLHSGNVIRPRYYRPCVLGRGGSTAAKILACRPRRSSVNSLPFLIMQCQRILIVFPHHLETQSLLPGVEIFHTNPITAFPYKKAFIRTFYKLNQHHSAAIELFL